MYARACVAVHPQCPSNTKELVPVRPNQYNTLTPPPLPLHALCHKCTRHAVPIMSSKDPSFRWNEKMIIMDEASSGKAVKQEIGILVRNAMCWEPRPRATQTTRAESATAPGMVLAIYWLLAAPIPQEGGRTSNDTMKHHIVKMMIDPKCNL